MQLSSSGATFVRLQEGFVDHWYADPGGVGTIGEGFTWASAGFRDWWALHRPGQAFGPGSTMTRAEADDCLIYVMGRDFGLSVQRFLGRDVPQHVYDAMCSTTYNCGAGTLADRWAGEARIGSLHVAATDLRTTRITQNGVRLAGLVTRRAEEAQLLELGDYTIGNATQTLSTAPMLVLGEHGSSVLDLQTRLAHLGLYTGALDGRFGQGTLAGVLAFQRAHHLTADGQVGPVTLAALTAA